MKNGKHRKNKITFEKEVGVTTKRKCDKVQRKQTASK